MKKRRQPRAVLREESRAKQPADRPALAWRQFFGVGMLALAMVLLSRFGWQVVSGEGVVSDGRVSQQVAQTQRARTSGQVKGLTDEIANSSLVIRIRTRFLSELEATTLSVLENMGVFGDLDVTQALSVGQNLLVSGSGQFSGDVNIDGTLTLANNVTGTNTTMALGTSGLLTSGTVETDTITFNQANGGNITAGDIEADEVTADNLVYSVEAGDGIAVSGTQEVEVSNDDKGSDQNIFKKIGLGSDTAEADGNSDTFSFVAGDGMVLSLDTSSDSLTITSNTGWSTSGTNVFLVNSSHNVGIGTSDPDTKLEIDSGVADMSGLKFSRITSATSPEATGTGGGKVLTVDSGGNVVLVTDQTATDATDILPAADTGGTLYYNGINWASSTNLYHNGGQVGISTNSPAARLHVLTNDDATIGQIIQREAGQTANLLEWRDDDGSTLLSYIDKDGRFVGGADIEGALDPGLTEGQVIFQGPDGITGDDGLFWDDTDTEFGVGTNAPEAKLAVVGSVTNKPVQSIKLPASHADNALEIIDSNDYVLTAFDSAGRLKLGQTSTQSGNAFHNNAVLQLNGITGSATLASFARPDSTYILRFDNPSDRVFELKGNGSSSDYSLSLENGGSGEFNLDVEGNLGVGVDSIVRLTVGSFGDSVSSNIDDTLAVFANPSDYDYAASLAAPAAYEDNTGDLLTLFNTDNTAGDVAGLLFKIRSSSSTTGRISLVGPGTTGDFAFQLRNGTTMEERMRITGEGNVGIGTSSFGTSAARVLAIANGTAPTTSIADGVQLYAIDFDDSDASSTSELFVRDEDGNATNLSPHNFDIIPEGPSEELAWSYFSVKDNETAIGVDLTRVVRTVEQLSGEQLIYIKDLVSGEYVNQGRVSVDTLGSVSENTETIAALNLNMTELEGRVLGVEQQLADLVATDGSLSQEALADYVSREELGGFAQLSLNLWRFVEEVEFGQDVTFLGRVFFHDPDLAGRAVVRAGGQQVAVSFARPYRQQPVITVSAESSQSHYQVVAKSEAGFTIQLTEPAVADVWFDWIALEDDGSIFESQANQSQLAEPATEPESSPIPMPTPSPSVSPSPEPVSSSEPSPTPESSPSPVVSPTPSPSPEPSPSASPQP